MADIFGVVNGVVTVNRVQSVGGVKMDDYGLDLHGQDIVTVKNIQFANPSVDNINPTAGALVIDKIAGKDRQNVLDRGASVEFHDIDATYGKGLKLPTLWSPNTAPTLTGNDAGFMYYDASAQALKVWTGAAWKTATLS
jgi:hypothetical protein